MNKPFSQACENNKQPILEVIQQYFTRGTILEIGSGTGQHAVYFSNHMTTITWQTSDRSDYHSGINAWLDESTSDNLKRPLELDVKHAVWPLDQVDGVFSANTAHIMDWAAVEKMFHGVGTILNQEGYFCLYGPVNMNGQFTSESNASFDMSLRMRDPVMGIRNLEDLQQLGQENNLSFIRLHSMPANNVIMVWQKLT